MKKHKTTNRVLAALLAVLMSVSLFPSAFAAESEVLIRTADELLELAYAEDEEELSARYRLACDIDMSQVTDERQMKAIGSYSGGSDDIAFEGVFDGDGHKITNLSTTGEALFGYVAKDGVVKNLTLENASVHYSANDSSKYPAAFVSLNYGTFENCRSVNSAVVSEYCSPAGGFAGTNFGTISKSGVCGGSVSFKAMNGTSHGGFVGNQRGGRIEECFSGAAVSAKKWAGGFAGKIEDGEVENCYALGNVTGSEECGGFAGAYMSDATLKNVYAANSVFATSGGGVAGGKGFSFSSAGIAENCAYCSDFELPSVSGAYENDIAWAKTSDEMKTASFAESLSDKWAYDASINGGYPYLINAAHPSEQADKDISVKLMLADYDKESYEFYKLKDEKTITLSKNTATVQDILDKAAEIGYITYAFGKNEQSGQVVTIDGITPSNTDGWMFVINDTLSAVGAQAAIVRDGDELLWYVGTPENGYSAPVWDEIGETVIAEEIVSASALAAIAESEKLDGHYKLTADIDLSGVEFSPIGSAETPFGGSFDGNGFTISNLTINSDGHAVGLFGAICAATLKNIKLENVNITGASSVGGLVGEAKSEENGTSLISNCYVSGKVTATGNSYIKQTDAGGLVGIADSFENKISGKVFASAIDNCTAEVEVSGSTPALEEAGHIGGFVGLNKGVISNSAAKGNVSGGNTVGGFVGSNYGGSIYSSNATGNVSGCYTVGGFVGFSGMTSIIENSYSSGDVAAVGGGGSNYGGFAGSLSGVLKACISSGTLSTGTNYNGGFAGSLDGVIWSYKDDLRTISNCFGNCVTSDGKTVKAIGSYIGGVHAPTDLAAEEIGVTKQTAEEKIEKMLADSALKNKLAREANKYKTGVAVPATVGVNSDITALVAKLNANASADDEIEVKYKSENKFIGATKTGYVLSEKPSTKQSETVTLSLRAGGAEYEQPINVTLYSSQNGADEDTLLKNIAKQYSKSGSDYWQMAVIGAYKKLFGDFYAEADTIEGFVENAVEAIETSDKDTTVAMYIIALRAIGYDPTKITLADGSKVNALDVLAEIETSGNNGDAYRLLAYNSCKEPDGVDEIISRLLNAQIDESGWSNNSDDGIDADTTGAVILGLSPHYEKNAEVKAAVDNAVEYLSSLMQADGNIKSSYKESNYGTNANTSAICAMGLAALGIDVKTDERFVKDEVSLYDGIMSFASENEDGFAYNYDNTSVNELATKQASLALMGIKAKKNVLDFSDMPSSAISLKKVSSGGSSSSGGQSASSSVDTNNITVYLTLVGDTIHKDEPHVEYSEWLKDVKAELPSNSTVGYALEKILGENGYSAKGIDSGYITELTTPGGITLGEYSNGEQSGWLYSVNNEAPTVGINDYQLKNGDKIKLYYADSWDEVKNELFPDVHEGDWFFEAASFASENNLISGNENGKFMPDEKLTRAMAITILGRLDKNTSVEAKAEFDDVSAEDWFAEYVAWGVELGVIFGVGDNLFAPNDAVTREQLAAMLYRYALAKGLTEKVQAADLSAYADAEEISAWATEAMQWITASQLMTGMGDGNLDAKGTATRAQYAVLIMKLNNLIK